VALGSPSERRCVARSSRTCTHSLFADVEFDPSKQARDERKSRVAKNERQRTQNLARAQAAVPEREQRKSEIERTLATTRASTASMGKFDKKLEGEKKLRGIKRKVCCQVQCSSQPKARSRSCIYKPPSTSTPFLFGTTRSFDCSLQFEPAEMSADSEKKSNLALLTKIGGAPAKRSKHEGNDAGINVRKAVRFASKGQGGVALARKMEGKGKGRPTKGKAGKKN
jgi:regulator of ribosome biosynthesis